MSGNSTRSNGTSSITRDEFNELNRAGGAPFDIVEEPGRLGVAFAKQGGIVKIWDLGDRGCVLETPATVAQAKAILAP